MRRTGLGFTIDRFRNQRTYYQSQPSAYDRQRNLDNVKEPTQAALRRRTEEGKRRIEDQALRREFPDFARALDRSLEQELTGVYAERQLCGGVAVVGNDKYDDFMERAERAADAMKVRTERGLTAKYQLLLERHQRIAKRYDLKVDELRLVKIELQNLKARENGLRKQYTEAIDRISRLQTKIRELEIRILDGPPVKVPRVRTGKRQISLT
jgi:hypothetical protein